MNVPGSEMIGKHNMLNGQNYLDKGIKVGATADEVTEAFIYFIYV